MGNDLFAFRAAIGLFNFNSKSCNQPKNKFAILPLAFLNLWLFSKCLLNVVLNICLHIASYFLINFYKHSILINFCYISLNRYCFFTRIDCITSLKFCLFLSSIFVSILLLVESSKKIKNALHSKFTKNLLLVIVLSILHICDPLSFTVQHDYNHRWAMWLHTDGDIHKKAPWPNIFTFFTGTQTVYLPIISVGFLWYRHIMPYMIFTF